MLSFTEAVRKHMASQTWHFAATSRFFPCECPGIPSQWNIPVVKEGGFYRSIESIEGKNHPYPRGLFVWGQISGLSILKRISYNYLATKWLDGFLGHKALLVSQCWPLLLAGRHSATEVVAGESCWGKVHVKSLCVSSTRTVLATLNVSQLSKQPGWQRSYQWFQALSAQKIISDFHFGSISQHYCWNTVWFSIWQNVQHSIV